MKNSTSPETSESQPGSTWIFSLADDVHHVAQSGIRSAASFRRNMSLGVQRIQDHISDMKVQYRFYEDSFFTKIKSELSRACDYPLATGGVATTLGLLLMRGPRRFLLRHTVGRLQSEEVRFLRAEKNVNDLSLSVNMMVKESRKLLERAALGEREMKHGYMELMKGGPQIQRLICSIDKVTGRAIDLRDGLREVPGREALKLRAEVASMAAALDQQRDAMTKWLMKMSDSGVPV